MSSNADFTARRGSPRTKTNREFIPEFATAPFSLRCGALFFDYVVIAIFPVFFLLIGRIVGNDGSELLKSEWNNLGWLLAFVILAVNFLMLPAVTGQTLGKLLTGIRIVSRDGGSPTFKALLFRQVLGGFLTIASFGVLFLIAVFDPKGRALHDFLSRTIVVSVNRQIRR